MYIYIAVCNISILMHTNSVTFRERFFFIIFFLNVGQSWNWNLFFFLLNKCKTSLVNFIACNMNLVWAFYVKCFYFFYFRPLTWQQWIMMMWISLQALSWNHILVVLQACRRIWNVKQDGVCRKPTSNDNRILKWLRNRMGEWKNEIYKREIERDDEG